MSQNEFCYLPEGESQSFRRRYPKANQVRDWSMGPVKYKISKCITFNMYVNGKLLLISWYACINSLFNTYLNTEF